MNNNLDIMYYEYMMEMSTENQKIIESLLTSKFVKLLNESSEDKETFIFEGNILESIIEFIKKIFDKIIGFFKKIIDFITGKNKNDEFKFEVNKQLIEKCEKRIKEISAEDRDKFKLEKADTRKAVKDRLPKIEALFKEHDDFLKKSMEKIDNALNKTFSFDLYEWHKPEKMEADDKTLAELTNQENIKKELTDITFTHIANIISEYKNGSESVDKFKNKLEECIKRYESYKKKAEKLKDRAAGEESEKTLTELKNYIFSATALLIKAAKANINLEIYNYNSQEKILKKFIEFKSSKGETK